MTKSSVTEQEEGERECVQSRSSTVLIQRANDETDEVCMKVVEDAQHEQQSGKLYKWTPIAS